MGDWLDNLIEKLTGAIGPFFTGGILGFIAGLLTTWIA